MLRLFCSSLLFCSVSTVFAQSAPVPIQPQNSQWQGSPTSQIMWVIGSATEPGIYAQRVKLAQGSVVAPHTHSDQRFSVVLSGTIYVGFGETFDESIVVPINAGELYIAPAGVPHFVWAKDGAAEYQESGVAPSVTTFIPAAN